MWWVPNSRPAMYALSAQFHVHVYTRCRFRRARGGGEEKKEIAGFWDRIALHCKLVMKPLLSAWRRRFHASVRELNAKVSR